MTTYNEDQIRQRHKERVSALVDLFGSTMAIPRDLIDRLQERNKEDWVQHVAERDGKSREVAQNAPLMPEVSDEQVASLDTPNPNYGTDEPDAQALADAEDATFALTTNDDGNYDVTEVTEGSPGFWTDKEAAQTVADGLNQEASDAAVG